jgi:hypothetical protein
MFKYPVFPVMFIEEAIFSPSFVLVVFVKNQVHGFMFGSSVLFHWSSFLFLCQYHSVFIDEAL